MPTRILFVDDDEFLLSALRRLVWDMEDEWDCQFADGAPTALDKLGETSFDVVVSDMRMPGMDGAELLTRVRETQPTAIRIILSGQSEYEEVFRAIGPAHYYLSKPCNSEDLKQAIMRAMALRENATRTEVHEIVSQVTTLPSLPRLTQQILRLLQSNEASIDLIGKLIAEDVALTAKVLQQVNSSYFGFQTAVSDVKQAAAYIGLSALKPLVFSAGVLSHFECEGFSGFSLEGMIQHSSKVATVARQIAIRESEDEQLAEHAMLAGTLHNVGMLVLGQHCQAKYQAAIQLAIDNSLPLCAAEDRVIGVNHAEVGGHLLGLWGLPHPVVEAVAFHPPLAL